MTFADYQQKILAAQYLGGGNQPEITTEGLRKMIHADAGLSMVEKTLLETAAHARAEEINADYIYRSMGGRFN